MFDPALNRLILLLFRGGLRRVWVQLRTPAGAALTLVSGTGICLGFVPSIFMAFTIRTGTPHDASQLAIFVPVGMFAMLAVSLLSGGGKQLLELRPAELQFVLAGPFSDTHILSYRLTTLVSAWIPISLFFCVVLAPHTGQWLVTLIGVFLSGTLLMIASVARCLATPRMTRSHELWLQFIVVGCVAAMLVPVTSKLLRGELERSLPALLESISQSPAGWVLFAPFRPFANIIVQPWGRAFFGNFGLSVLLIVAVTWFCYRINVGFSELAVEGVARRAAKLARLHNGDIVQAQRRHGKIVRTLGELPYWRGWGPIVWLQISIGWRLYHRWIGLCLTASLLGVIAIGLATALRIVQLSELRTSFAMPAAMLASTYLVYFAMMMAPLGFAISARQLSLYKSLPVPAPLLAAGMIAGWLVPIVGFRLSFFILATIFSSHGLLVDMAILLAALALDLGMVTAINLVTAGTSLRVIPSGSPDVLQGGRVMLTMIVFVMASMPTLIAAGAGVGLVGASFGFEWGRVAIAIVVSVLTIQPPLWWLTGLAFDRRELPAES